MRKTHVRVAAGGVLVLLATAACGGSISGGGGGGGGASAPGVTATSVTIGSTQPLTGPVAPGYSEMCETVPDDGSRPRGFPPPRQSDGARGRPAQCG